MTQATSVGTEPILAWDAGARYLPCLSMQALDQILRWGGESAAVVIDAEVVRGESGPLDRPAPWASVTKLATSYAALIAVETGQLDLDEPAGPPGATLRHLLAHASGLPFEGSEPIARPGRRRIYSNSGFDVIGAMIDDRVPMGFSSFLQTHVLDPLGIVAELRGRPSQGLVGTVRGIARIGRELLAPSLVTADILTAARTVAFPGLSGTLPGVARYDHLDWGLGPEIRGDKSPHWTGTANSPLTFGHFGGSGAFLWVDPLPGLALAAVSGREFGPWALSAWPRLSDAVLAGG